MVLNKKEEDLPNKNIISNKESLDYDNDSTSIIDYEFDLNNIFSICKRNKSFIILVTLISLITGVLYSFALKKVWKGEFQIVMENKRNSSTDLVNPGIAKITGLKDNESPLLTQVGILKSPSVLLDAFNFLKKEKLKLNESFNSMVFKDWKNDSLLIDLERGTSILNIAYKDTDKELIIPVLNIISKTYQDYSEKNRLKKIESSDNYFKNQIKEFTDKSLKSIRDAQEYAIDQNLTFLNITELDKEIPNSINISAIRVKSINEIKAIEDKIEQIKALDKEHNKILFLASTISGFNSEFAIRLKNVNNELNLKRYQFTQEDVLIKNLINERLLLTDLLKEQIISYLNINKIEAQARLKAAERPKGVIIKYNQLLDNASRNRKILFSLEDEYINLLLDKARISDPWELITEPTILSKRVSPKRKRIIAIWTLLGFFIGVILSILFESKKNKLYSSEEISKIIKSPIILKLNPLQKENSKELFAVFKNKFLPKLEGDFAFLNVGNFSKKANDFINDYLFENIGNKAVTDSFQKSIEFPNFVVIVYLGITTKQDLLDLKNKLLLESKNLVGIISIDEADKFFESND